MGFCITKDRCDVIPGDVTLVYQHLDVHCSSCLLLGVADSVI